MQEIYHLIKIICTVVLVELSYSDVVSILSDFGDLVLEVEVSELGYVTLLEVVDWLRLG
jgi:hypothetical protein